MPSHPFKILQLTDLHVRPKGIAAYRVCETTMLTERALRVAARLQPDVVIITGDLADCGLAAEYKLLAAMLERHLPMPVFPIPGNHDRREPMLDHIGGARQEGGFIHYAVQAGPVRLVMLDTLVPSAGHGSLDSGRLDWLDRTLAAAPGEPTLVAMHHPPFLCGIAHLDRINLQDHAGFAAVIGRHPQVGRIVCGHHHRPVMAQVAHAVASISPSVAHQLEFDLDPAAPPAFVLEPPAFQLHLWSQPGGFVSHTVTVEDYPGPYPFILEPDYPGVS